MALDSDLDLDGLRRRIDAIDDQILELLDARAEVAEGVAAAKTAVHAPTYDPERERAVLDRLSAKASGRFPREAIRAVYREVMSACLALQEPVRVSFLGPAGTFSHAAARLMFGLAARYREATTIEGVFEAVKAGHAACGVVPIENSSEGSVANALDALIEGGLLIRREMVIEVSQCLLTRAGELTGIERVYSHPQALAQCRLWLAKHLPAAQQVQTPSTAAAAKEAVEDGAGAVIASRLSSELYGLPVLRERVQDRPENATRFVLLAGDDAPRTGADKTTMVFSVHHERGALKRALELFDAEGVNLTRIESRPSRQKAWDYIFLVDLEGHREEEPIARATAALVARGGLVRHLGSYPRHQGPPLPGG